jgi:exosome complex component RRP4
MPIISEELSRREEREIVVPGSFLGTKPLVPGSGTYRIGNNIYASILGIKAKRASHLTVIPLGGRYIPKVGDAVIGKIIDLAPNLWVVDINSPYPAILHTANVPWKVEFGETSKFLNISSLILCDVLSVDEVKRVELSMSKLGSKKLSGGQVIEVASSKVPRIIGRGASMITTIKNYTNCKIFVGQNGRIWLEGPSQNINIAILAIKKIESEAHTIGLTERIQKFLEKWKK